MFFPPAEMQLRECSGIPQLTFFLLLVWLQKRWGNLVIADDRYLPTPLVEWVLVVSFLQGGMCLLDVWWCPDHWCGLGQQGSKNNLFTRNKTCCSPNFHLFFCFMPTSRVCPFPVSRFPEGWQHTEGSGWLGIKKGALSGSVLVTAQTGVSYKKTWCKQRWLMVNSEYCSHKKTWL